MSSILKALKRLEAETCHSPAVNGDQTSWLSQAEVASTGFDRIWEALFVRGRRLFFTALGLTVIAIAAGLAWMATGDDKQEGNRPPAPSAPASRLSLNPIQARNFSATAQPEATGPAAPVDSTRSASPVLSSSRSAPAPAPRSATIPLAKDAAKSGVKPPAIGRVEKAGASGKDPLFPVVPTDAGLTLQAISWSELAEKRIAVINGRVLHLGDIVADFRVESIDPDTVLVSRSGQTFRLAYRQQ